MLVRTWVKENTIVETGTATIESSMEGSSKNLELLYDPATLLLSIDLKKVKH